MNKQTKLCQQKQAALRDILESEAAKFVQVSAEELIDLRAKKGQLEATFFRGTTTIKISTPLVEV